VNAISNIAKPEPSDKRESLLAWVFIAIAASVQWNRVLKWGAVGQDFAIHRDLMLLAARDPIGWLTAAHDRVDPPLYHLIIAAVYTTVGPTFWSVATGLLNSAANVFALRTLYNLTKICLTSSVLRIATVAFVGTLPVFAATSIVFATDAFCQLPVILTCYEFSASLLYPNRLRRALLVSVASVAFLVSIKYIAVALIPAVVATICIVGRASRRNWREIFCASLIFVIPTTTLSLYWIFQKSQNVLVHFSPAMGGLTRPPPKLHVKNLLFFTPGDSYLLTAPCLNDIYISDKSVKRSLYNTNYFSYPGLLGLGIFTDFLLLFNPDRSKSLASQIAVKSALPIYLGAILLVMAGSTLAITHYFRKKTPQDLAILICMIFGGAWHLFIIAVLPLATMAMPYGYWTPRLILPSIMLYVIVAFSALDRISGRVRNYVIGASGILVGWQCILSLLILV
jgi:hypothetical protein